MNVPKSDTTSEFFKLVPRKPVKPEKTEEKKPKVKKPHFKKGGWKHWLYKKLRKWNGGKFVDAFHFEKRENILISCGDKVDVRFFNKPVDKKTLKKLQKLSGKDNVFVLVDMYNKCYMKFSVESYLKLMKIDRMIINFRLRANNDDVEIVDVFEREDIISNINDLANYINAHRQGIEGVYEIQSECCCFTYYDFLFKIVVMKTDGSVETYKGDMNEFMKTYGLLQF